MPERIQRRRTRGWRMPEGAVFVGRPTVFGNPFSVQRAAEVFDCRKESAHQHAAEWFRDWLACSDPAAFGDLGAWGDTAEQRSKLLARLPDLRGKDLACFCAPDLACHADILLELANAPEARKEGE